MRGRETTSPLFRRRLLLLGALLAPTGTKNQRIAMLSSLLGLSPGGIRKWYYGSRQPVAANRSIWLERIEREIAVRSPARKGE